MPYKMAPESGARSETSASGSHFGNDNYIVSYDERTMYDCTYQDVDQYTQTNRHNCCTSSNCGLDQARPNKSLAIVISYCTSAAKAPLHLYIYNQVTIGPGDWG